MYTTALLRTFVLSSSFNNSALSLNYNVISSIIVTRQALIGNAHCSHIPM